MMLWACYYVFPFQMPSVFPADSGVRERGEVNFTYTESQTCIFDPLLLLRLPLSLFFPVVLKIIDFHIRSRKSWRRSALTGEKIT